MVQRGELGFCRRFVCKEIRGVNGACSGPHRGHHAERNAFRIANNHGPRRDRSRRKRRGSPRAPLSQRLRPSRNYLAIRDLRLSTHSNCQTQTTPSFEQAATQTKPKGPTTSSKPRLRQGRGGLCLCFNKAATATKWLVLMKVSRAEASRGCYWCAMKACPLANSPTSAAEKSPVMDRDCSATCAKCDVHFCRFFYIFV